MFSLLSRLLLIRAASSAARGNAYDRETIYERATGEERTYLLLLHSRQAAIAFLLGEIIFMLGIVADVILLSVIFGDKIRLVVLRWLGWS
jgi:hypothetical protein